MKNILVVGIGVMDHALSRAMSNLAAEKKPTVVIVEEQGPPRPPAPLTNSLKDYASEFKKTLSAVRVNVNEPATTNGQPFYLSLPKYKKRKP